MESVWSKEKDSFIENLEDDEHKEDIINSYYDELNKLKKFLVILNKDKFPKSKNLNNACELLNTYFRKHLMNNKNGWVYRLDKGNNRHYPFIIRSIRFKEDRHDSRSKWIDIELVNNTRNKTATSTVTINYDDLKMAKNSIPDVVRHNNILLETPELLKEYEDYIKEYNDKEVLQNHQFIDSEGLRYVNDNIYEKTSRKDKFNNSLNLYTSSNLVNHSDNCLIPFEPLIYVFNLNKHYFEWVDTRDVEPYVYDDEIAEKLILPEEHKGLINILTNDEIIDNGSDIIEGKSGGTIILCKGGPGLGKTLTSEIYSEIKHKPLYSVHSSQLGTNGTKIEETLKKSFNRAERWGAVLLIDEADVYIRERDNDTNHNAIVASFLRVMEYYNGLMFMTTNRDKDIDDAIISRCMAVLTYQNPIKEVRAMMWKIYLEQFNIDYSPELINELSEEFKKISGRDIKNVTRLVSRFIQGYKVPPTIDVFKKCATFRGVEIL